MGVEPACRSSWADSRGDEGHDPAGQRLGARRGQDREGHGPAADGGCDQRMRPAVGIGQRAVKRRASNHRPIADAQDQRNQPP